MLTIIQSNCGFRARSDTMIVSRPPIRTARNRHTSFRRRSLFRILPFALACTLLPTVTPAADQPREQTPPAQGVPDELVVPREESGAVPPETVIEGDHLEMVADEHEARFIFTDNVRVIGNNIILTCDRLKVISSRQDGEQPTGERLGGMGRIRSIVASGRVHVSQEGREATAGRAEVSPDEGRVVLTGDPVIRDQQGEVSGDRITLYQGLERAVVESGPDRPARVMLPDLPDLGFRPGQAPTTQE